MVVRPETMPLIYGINERLVMRAALMLTNLETDAMFVTDALGMSVLRPGIRRNALRLLTTHGHARSLEACVQTLP